MQMNAEWKIDVDRLAVAMNNREQGHAFALGCQEQGHSCALD
jgi:hypothetical protein